MAMFGADTAQLKETAALVQSGSVELQEITARLSAQVSGASAWQGADADQFRQEWSSTSVPALTRSVEFLKDAADALNRNAEQQADASADSGGAGLMGGQVGKAIGMAAGIAKALARVLSATGGGSVDVPAGMSPKETATWWNDLTDAQRRDLVENHPELVGNLDGLPGSVRDEANRLRLVSERERLKAELVGATEDRAAEIEESLRALDAIEGSIDTKGETTQLLLLDVDNGGQPKAAISVGDVDTADHVAVITPGISTTVSGDMAGSFEQARNLKLRSESILREEDQGKSIATIAWLGYEMPPAVGVDPGVMKIITPDAAMAGGLSLASFGEGIRASHSGDSLQLSALGHSYGSLTTGYAVQATSVFDTAVFFGSPGIGTNNLNHLHVPSDQVFVLEAKGDFVADAGVFGGDPNHIWGINHLDTGDSRGSEIKGHSDYLKDGSSSQFNMAAVISGNADVAGVGSNNGFGDLAGGIAMGNQRVAAGVGNGVAQGAAPGARGFVDNLSQGNYIGAYADYWHTIGGGVLGAVEGGARGAENALGAVVGGMQGVADDIKSGLADGWNNLFDSD